MRFRFFLVLIFAAIAALIFAQRQGGEDVMKQAPPILQKAFNAVHKIRYTGTRVVEFKKGPDRKKHTEFVIVDGARSRVEFPGGSPFAGQIIVESGKQRMHYFPDKNEVHMLPARREDAVFRLVSMAKRFGKEGGLKFSEDAGEAVAGKATRLATISDKDANPLQKLWINPETGLILRRVIFDRVGSPIGSFEFTRVNFKPVLKPGDFVIKRNARILKPMDLAKRLASENDFAPVFLPASEGYELEHSRVDTWEQGSKIFAQRYEGKKGNLTLFQVKGKAPEPRNRRGRENLIYSWESNGRNFALVGGSSLEELQRLAKVLGGP